MITIVSHFPRPAWAFGALRELVLVVSIGWHRQHHNTYENELSLQGNIQLTLCPSSGSHKRREQFFCDAALAHHDEDPRRKQCLSSYIPANKHWETTLSRALVLCTPSAAISPAICRICGYRFWWHFSGPCRGASAYRLHLLQVRVIWYRMANSRLRSRSRSLSSNWVCLSRDFKVLGALLGCMVFVRGCCHPNGRHLLHSCRCLVVWTYSDPDFHRCQPLLGLLLQSEGILVSCGCLLISFP